MRRPFRAQVGLVVIAPQLAVDQAEERRVGRGTEAGLARHAEVGGARRGVLLHGDRVLIPRLAQHEVAALERLRRVAVRVVHRGTLHQRDEQCRLGEREVLHFLAEVVLRREPYAVDRAVAVLAEVDFVQVSLEDLLLAVVHLEQHRHDELGELAPQRALGREEEVLHELLRDGASALHPARADAERRARHAAHGEARVGEVGAVLGGDQRLHRVRRHLGEAHQHPVLVPRGIDAADRQRLDPRERHFPAFGVGERAYGAAVEGEAHLARGLRPVPEHEGAQADVEPLAAAHVPAAFGLARRVGLLDQRLVAELAQLVLEVGQRQALPGVQLEGPRVDSRGQREAPALELGPHPVVEVQRERARAGEQHEERDAGGPQNLFALPHTSRILPARMWLSCGVANGRRCAVRFSQHAVSAGPSRA
jgi:hypothetical protein